MTDIKNMKQIIVGILAVGVLAGIFYWANVEQGPGGGAGPEPTACTMEALLCPDGSGVGRTGDKCAFAPCPDLDKVVGILDQQGGEFRLIMGAPPTFSGGEVSYALPIEVKVSNVLGKLLGRRVEVFGTFREGNILAVERLEELPGEAGDPTLGKVKVGSSTFINGVVVELLEILEDSRCPSDVKCVWAGQARLKAYLRSDTDQATVELVTNGEAAAIDTYQVSIWRVEPAVESAGEIPAEDYEVVFKVEENG